SSACRRWAILRRRRAMRRKHYARATSPCSSAPCCISTTRSSSSTSRRGSPSRAAPTPSAISTPCWTRCVSARPSGRGSSTASTATPAACWCWRGAPPPPRRGRIDQPLAKLPGPAGERVTPDEEEGKRAVTYYRTVSHAGDQLAWLSLQPITGRTHQLRAHCVALETPILGDGKYGGGAAHPAGVPNARKLHLHARALSLPHPRGGRLQVTAPLPPHMKAT